MVSDRKNKKRPATMSTSAVTSTTDVVLLENIKEEEPSSKRSKKSASPKKSVKSSSKKGIKKEPEVNDDEPLWPEPDLQELIRKIEVNIPSKDSLRFDSRAGRLDWEAVAFGDYSAKQCMKMWLQIQRRLRRFRLLKEVVEDAKTWVSQPWTNFYRSQKRNRHPDQPRRPLSTYMIFYLEKKDKVAKENPKLEMTEISKRIAVMYKNLPEKQKAKFVQKAAQQRQEYEMKLEAFYKQHPELVPKVSKREKSTSQNYPGPRKPRTPFAIYFADKLEKHKNDHEVSKAALSDLYREQWKELSEKKRIYWIKLALEDEHRYQEELKIYMEEHPDFTPLALKPVLTRNEQVLRERNAGKPVKPPNSGYSLFSRLMLSSDEIKHVDSKQRMSKISSMWRNQTQKDKRKYQERVKQMLEQYKLDFATYLESLPPEKQEEELQASQRRKKPTQATRKRAPKKEMEGSEEEEEEESSEEEEDQEEAAPASKVKKESTIKLKKPKLEELDKPLMKLFKGEPEPPPVMAYKLFLKTFMTEAVHIPEENRLKEAPRYWQMLPETDKAKYRKKLTELKQKYIASYEKFLKSLSQEELKEYSLLKQKCKQSEESFEEDSDDKDECDSEEPQDSGSGDDQQSDEVRVTGIVRTASFPPLPRRGGPVSTDSEDSDSDDSSSGSSSDSSSGSGSEGEESDSDSDTD